MPVPQVEEQVRFVFRVGALVIKSKSDLIFVKRPLKKTLSFGLPFFLLVNPSQSLVKKHLLRVESESDSDFLFRPVEVGRTQVSAGEAQGVMIHRRFRTFLQPLFIKFNGLVDSFKNGTRFDMAPVPFHRLRTELDEFEKSFQGQF